MDVPSPLVRWSELRRAGLTRRQLDAAQRQGSVVRMAHGWYRLASASPPAGPPGWAEALHQAPSGARVGGAAAAHLRQLDGFDDWRPPLTIDAPATAGHRRGGVRRLTRLGPAVTVAGLPTSSIEQTLLRLGAGLAPRPGCVAARAMLPAVDLVELAVECALRRRLTSVASLQAATDAAGRRTPGRRVLRAVLTRRPPAAPPTESYLETRLLQVLRNGGITEPARQVELRDSRGRFVARVDLLLDHIVLEADGFAHHRTPQDLTRDRARTNALHTLGYVVLGFTFDEVEHRPDQVLGTVRTVRGRAPTRRGG